MDCFNFLAWISAIFVAFAPPHVIAARFRKAPPAVAHPRPLLPGVVLAKPPLLQNSLVPQASPTLLPTFPPSLPKQSPSLPPAVTPKVSQTSRKLPGAMADSKQIPNGTSAFHPFQSQWGGVHFLFSLPPDLKPGASPRGLFLMLHACQRNAKSFFGVMPEEAAMTAAVLRRGFAVAAPDSPPNNHGDCWDVLADGRRIAKAIPEAQAQLRLQQAPLYAVGISSGGMLLASLVHDFKVPFSGVSFNVSPQNTRFFQGAEVWPRTSFVYAQGDRWALPDKVLAAAKALQRRGTPVQVLSVGPQPFEELPTRATKIGIDSRTLFFAVDLLRRVGFTRVLHGDFSPPSPGTSPLRTALTPYATDEAVNYLKRTVLRNAIVGHGGALTEEMNVLAGVHGPTSEHFEKVLDFLVEQSSRPSAASRNNTTKLT